MQKLIKTLVVYSIPILQAFDTTEITNDSIATHEELIDKEKTHEDELLKTQEESVDSDNKEILQLKLPKGWVIVQYIAFVFACLLSLWSVYETHKEFKINEPITWFALCVSCSFIFISVAIIIPLYMYNESELPKSLVIIQYIAFILACMLSLVSICCVCYDFQEDKKGKSFIYWIYDVFKSRNQDTLIDLCLLFFSIFISVAIIIPLVMYR